MKLSIIILFCDKDYFFIPKLIENIQRVVKINHEIVLIDNRENKKNCLINTHGIEIHSMNKNLYQFEARRRAIEFVTGNYMWFVDADDIVLPINKNYFLSNKDFYYFNFAMIKQDYTKKIGIENGNVKELRGGSSHALWNIFVKTEVWKKFIHLIPKNLILKAQEDVIYFYMIRKFSTSYELIENCFYLQRCLSNCESNGNPINQSFEWFKLLFSNLKIVKKFFDDNFTQEERLKYELSKNHPFDESLNLYIQGRLNCVKESEKSKCIEWLQNEYGEYLCQ